MPLLVISTIVLLFAVCELTARHFFSSEDRDTCVMANAVSGSMYLRSCTSRMKASEGPWVVNQYNDCGYRSKQSCGPKPAGSTRIALIGSSVVDGLFVDYDHTLGGRAEAVLTARCRRPVEMQALGRLQCSLGCMYHRIDEALALKPDVLILAVSPYDIEITSRSDVADRDKPMMAMAHEADVQQNKILIRRVQMFLKNSRTTVAAEHYLFEDPASYLRLYMLYGDKADFLRQPFTAAWEQRLQNVDLLLGDMAQKAKVANVPFVLLEMPDEPQGQVVSLRQPLPGIDATALNQRLGEMAARHGIAYIDPLHAFRHAPRASDLFFVVNGHLNGNGYGYISSVLVDQLTSGFHPLLPGCSVAAQQAATAPPTLGGAF